jgi:hypothetical protein
MCAQGNVKNKALPVSLLILEGETEEIFYSRVRDIFLKGIRLKPIPIRGQRNINAQVTASLLRFVQENRSDNCRAYCCIDSESNKKLATSLDITLIKNQIKQRNMRRVLSINAVLAVPEIESWFFYDIEGIYKHLRAPKHLCNIKKYSLPKNFGKKELQRLFEQFGHNYLPGKRAENFINRLDIKKIVNKCKSLERDIERIIRQAADTSNHIF